MSKTRHSRFVIIVLPMAALACIGLLIGTNWLLSLPDRAEQVFGPPSPRLDTVGRVRLSAILLSQADDLTEPTDPSGGPIPFQVEPGESIPSITGRLYQQGLISNPVAFRTYLQYAGLDVTLQAGDYILSPDMSPLTIARSLQDATPTQVTFRVLPGWRLEEIAANLPTSGLSIPPSAFLEAAVLRPPSPVFLAELPAGTPLEGYMYPDVYELDRTLTARELIGALLTNFDLKVSGEIRAAISRQGLSLHQGITLASIVERENVVREEAPLIASVYLNRLEIGMKLDADPTVQYALGFNADQGTWWTNPLSLKDLSVDSPYNTYLYAGLPPGPIANPDINTLRAVAFPAKTPYYFFRATCDDTGRHVFAETFEEHQNNACP
jgi:UPF0755 protein